MKINYRKLPTKGNFLYVVRWADTPQYVKIGMTSTLRNRLKSYTTCYPSHLCLVALRKFDTEIELRHEEEALLEMTSHHDVRPKSEWRHVNDETMAWIERRVGTELKAEKLLNSSDEVSRGQDIELAAKIRECSEHGLAPRKIAKILRCRVADVYRVIL